jgi:hypothetical protein
MLFVLLFLPHIAHPATNLTKFHLCCLNFRVILFHLLQILTPTQYSWYYLVALLLLF